MRTFRILFLLCFVSLLGEVVYKQSGLRPSGLKIKGQNVSEADVQSSIHEVQDVASSFQKGERANVSGVEVKTSLGRAVRDMVAGIQIVERWHENALKGLSLESLMDAKAMESDISIKESVSRLAELERVEAEYFKRRKSVLIECADTLGHPTSFDRQMGENMKTLDEMLESERAVFRAIRDYLMFGLDHRHEADIRKGTVYWQQDDLARAKDLLSSINQKDEANSALASQLEARTKNALAELKDIPPSP